jgi:hypothetical protein
VCHKHGGSAPQVRAKANERLREMVLPALTELRKIIDHPSTTDADKLKAINMVLNRTGYSERHNIDVGLREPNPWDALTGEGSPAFKIVRGRGAIVGDDERPALEGDEFDQYNLGARRNANRAELDSDTYLPDLDDADVVVGRVVEPGQDDFDPLHVNTRERAAYRRPGEFSGGPSDDEKPWAAYERRVQEGQE